MGAGEGSEEERRGEEIKEKERRFKEGVVEVGECNALTERIRGTLQETRRYVMS